MTDVDIQEKGFVHVRKPGESFVPFKTPKGFSDLTFLNTLVVVHALFLELGRFPTLDEMHRRWPSIPKNTYARILVTDECIAALEHRGILFDLKQGLDYEQHMALLVLSNPGDRRTTNQKLRDLGIPYSRYQSWMRNPVFQQARLQMAENNLRDSVPVLVDGVVRKAEEGDLQAIKLGLEMTGRYNPNAEAVADAREIVRVLIEAVIRQLRDYPELRRAILDEIESIAVGYALNQPRQIER